MDRELKQAPTREELLLLIAATDDSGRADAERLRLRDADEWVVRREYLRNVAEMVLAE